MARSLATLVLALAAAAVVTAADVERDARVIETMLVAPCCFTQQVSLHQSAAAAEVRQDIRRRLGAGESQEQILQAYVQRYGKRILVQPPAEGFDRMLYILPPVGFVLTAGVVVLLVRRFASAAPSGGAAGADGTGVARDDGYASRLDDQLRDLD